MGKAKKRHSGMTQTREPPTFDSYQKNKTLTERLNKLKVDTKNHYKKWGGSQKPNE